MAQDIAKITDNYVHRFNVNNAYFQDLPPVELSLIVVIPAFKEPDILPTLKSLEQCKAPQGKVELIIVVNAAENVGLEDLKTNQNTVDQIKSWEKSLLSNVFTIKIIREEQLPKKFAGAGLARKIGMDEALRRWSILPKNGPILCLDADCTVSENYLVSAEKAFSNPLIQQAHFQFEHFYLQEKDAFLRSGIIQYELHLRYHIQGLKWAGYPNAKHTVGSCMAVRASSYAKSGGMNRRKAGEDFYFMHKLLPVCQFTYLEAVVYPSCRSSDRVPFGTGRAQLEFLDSGVQIRNTYHPDTYICLKKFFDLVPNLFNSDQVIENVPDELKKFLLEQHFESRVKDIKSQSSSLKIFIKNFWQWMDGFMVLKMTHYLRDSYFPEQAIDIAANSLIKILEESQSTLSLTELLTKFKQLDLDYFSDGLTMMET
jgi:hypothetical protein|tara:strand:- start:2120 stop:3400 length:1281 start_codon:yes stop_codon:yes gene_type:complete